MNQMEAEIEEDLEKDGMYTRTRDRPTCLHCERKETGYSKFTVEFIHTVVRDCASFNACFADEICKQTDNSCKYYWNFALVSLSFIS
jgi:hypothetical protein